MNRLSTERSAYLRHAAHQIIDWYPWSDEAFEKAEREDKPLFLSSGAVWCHWCHVMAEECFSDEEIARLMNENFVSIKLDRDERPDIDRRYQMAVSVMGSGSGWPLSVFLTPDRRPFYGGTYFPPDDRMGRPGFRKILKAVSSLYRTNRSEISEYTEKISQALKSEPLVPEEISAAVLDDALKNVLKEFDPQNGGFGSAPKFPMPGALEFLLNRYVLTGNEAAGHAARKTLDAMALGGFHDQIGGGFHRYSTDPGWIIPHFEKMADDNAWLLGNYLNAYAAFGSELYRSTALGVISFIDGVLSDPEGGFYASQDADVSPGDEGGYFTWTDAEFREALNEDEQGVLSMHFMDESGSMHHDRDKKVLFVVNTAEDISAETGWDIREVTEIIRSGRAKLLQRRNGRRAPFIDKALYTSVNGMLISAYMRAYRVLGMKHLLEFALKSLERIMGLRFDGTRLYHTDNVKALLDDHVHLAGALIAAYEVTGDALHVRRAEDVMGACIRKLWDGSEGGFFDSEDEVFSVKIKAVEDIPHPSANALSVILLLKLHHITGKNEYRDMAERTLMAFSSRARNMSTHAGTYFCALDAYFNLVKLDLHASPSSDLAGEALSVVCPCTVIVHSGGEGGIVPCIGATCHGPLNTREGIRDFFRKIKGSSVQGDRS